MPHLHALAGAEAAGPGRAPLDRRAFLAALGGALLAGTACARPSWGATPQPRRPLGLQLYTVRQEMERDVARTLARVAAIGYREVEFAGYFDTRPADVRALLERLGLRAPAAHVPFDRTGDAWAAALAEAAAVGHEYVIIPWLQASTLRSADDWRRVAARFDTAAAAARAAGLGFGYHNHDFEFRPVDGVVPYDLLLAETDPATVHFELDLYWAVRAGRDPLDYLARHPGRFRLVHVKDSAGPPAHRMTDVGRGTIDFARILPAAARAGVTHFFVEHDEPADPLGSARTSFEHLSRLAF